MDRDGKRSSKETKSTHHSQQLGPNTTHGDSELTQDELLQRSLSDATSQTLTPAVIRSLQHTHGNQFVLQLMRKKQTPVPIHLSASSATPKLQRLKDDDVFQVIEAPGGNLVTKSGKELPDKVYVVSAEGFLYVHKTEINDGGKSFKKAGKNVEMKGICFFHPEKQEMFRVLGLFFPPTDDDNLSSSSDSGGEDDSDSEDNDINWVNNPAYEPPAWVDNPAYEPLPWVDNPAYEPKGDDSDSDEEMDERVGKEGEPKLKSADTSAYYDEVIGEAFIGDPKSTDVDQGIGNCYFMATLAALIDHPAGQKMLKNMIVPLDGNTKYLVKLAIIQEDEVELNGEVIITAWFPIQHDQFAYALSSQKRVDALKPGASVALWPVILEKAYAIHKDRRAALKKALSEGIQDDQERILEQAKGDYALLEGGFANLALQDLGAASTIFNPQGKSILDVQTWLKANHGKPQIAGSCPRGGWTNHMQQIDFQAIGATQLLYKHVTPYKRETFEIKYDGHKLNVDEGGFITNQAQNVGQVRFDSGEIHITNLQLCPNPVAFNVEFQEYFDEADAKNIQPKHAYMVKEIEGERVKFYDTSSRTEVFVTLAQITKYFNSLVAANI